MTQYNDPTAKIAGFKQSIDSDDKKSLSIP
jgi:hypothetical protein